MKNYRITVNGTAYDVAVEELGAGAAPAATAAPAPVAAAAPAPAAPAAPAAWKQNFPENRIPVCCVPGHLRDGHKAEAHEDVHL